MIPLLLPLPLHPPIRSDTVRPARHSSLQSSRTTDQRKVKAKSRAEPARRGTTQVGIIVLPELGVCGSTIVYVRRRLALGSSWVH